ncbi:MAG: hypothetical protein FJ390_02250 [Verrucomicrobia bacterium]|nr:hypothetical protein [Verrucomicrobiota bacterium]
MIPATLSAASSALASQAQHLHAAANTADQQLNSNQLKDAIHQQLGLDAHSSLPADVEAFYTMGPDAVKAPAEPPVNMSPTMGLDSANLFEDLPHYLSKVGGPEDPTAILAAQVQVIQASLGWQLMGQIAAKSVSGIQSLLNNQV